MSICLAIFGKPRYLGLMTVEDPIPPKGAWLAVETMRGIEMALIGGPLSKEQEERYRSSCGDDSSDGQVKGGEPSLQEITFLRSATDEDHKAATEAREEENDILLRARTLLRNHKISMKLVDVEFLLDRKKLFFYFTSEQRVDFRAYVRDLAKEFKTRIELRQIGVRDEAKTVKGLAPCGQRCCCSYWLHRFSPICIKMVKEQNLALNPTKISGICGRLMCCMSFEHHMYGSLWKSLPNPGSKIRTNSGTYMIDGVDLSSESVRVRCPDGRNILVRTGDFARFRDTVTEGKPWEDEGEKKERKSAPDGGARNRRPLSGEVGGPFEKVDGEKKGPRPDKKRQEQPGSKPDASEKAKPEGGAAPDGTAKKRRRRRKKPSGGSRPEGEKVQSPGTPSGEGAAPAPEKNQPREESGQKRRSAPRKRRPPRDKKDQPQPPQDQGE